MNSSDQVVVRITIRDPEQTVSFLTTEATILRLVAGCSASPATLGDLLVATDTYQRGVAASVMADLMEFDKVLHREGAAFIHNAIRLSRDSGKPLERAFQVLDEITESEARECRGCEVVMIDLGKQTISVSKGLTIPASGEVRIYEDEVLTDRTVTYILPQGWKIRPF